MAFATRPKPRAADRKRHGNHHRHDKRYKQSYWPYLPMLLIVALGIVINSAWSKGSVLGTKSDFSVTSLLTSTNAERLKNHEPALSLDAQLTAAAQAKAEDMAQKNYWSHNSPDGKTPWAFITGAGYQYQRAGENLAYGFNSADESVAGWMGSPEHRANILNASYQNVGFGVVSSPDFMGEGPETIVVAAYGQPSNSSNDTTAITNTPGNDEATSVLGAAATTQPVSRIQILSGSNSQAALVVIIVLCGGAMTLFLLRHGYRVHCLLSSGESFVVHHPYLDIVIVFLITAGVILTRSSGIIG